MKKAADAIRFHYYRQLSLIRKIPYYALEADGRGGWLDEWQRAYRYCMIAIHGGMGKSYDTFLELRTGTLLSVEESEKHFVITPQETFVFGNSAKFTIASDKHIYEKLAHQSPKERFDVAACVRVMIAKMDRPYHNTNMIEQILRQKAESKDELDALMAIYPEDEVRAILREQGFPV